MRQLAILPQSFALSARLGLEQQRRAVATERRRRWGVVRTHIHLSSHSATIIVHAQLKKGRMQTAINIDNLLPDQTPTIC
jgi:hypothetical protein